MIEIYPYIQITRKAADIKKKEIGTKRALFVSTTKSAAASIMCTAKLMEDLKQHTTKKYTTAKPNKK